jgi:hypothetical protein
MEVDMFVLIQDTVDAVDVIDVMNSLEVKVVPGDDFLDDVDIENIDITAMMWQTNSENE